MNFIKEMRNTLNDEFNYAQTENDALGYRTSGKELLDLNFKVASLRAADDPEIIESFMKAFYEDKLLAVKWLFYARDVREGLGERRFFRVVFEYLCQHNPDAVKDLIKYIPEYGRYDDLLCIIGTQHTDNAIEVIKAQLKEDEARFLEGKAISLMAKWMPSINTSSTETVDKAKQIIRLLGMNEAEYRKTLSKFRKHIDVVEVKMSAQQWDGIDYSAVPSRANIIYKDAFMRHDEERRTEFLEALEKGETKINATVLYPHDIVHKYHSDGWGLSLKNEDITLEQLWKSLPNTVAENGHTIVVADGSGSMTCNVGNTNLTALSVANALAIYFSERSNGQFKNQYITFSESPQLVDFSGCDSLRDKIELALRYNEVADTNIEAVFDLILMTAVKSQIQQSELPQNILIISDMEFNEATYSRPDKRLFSIIGDKYTQMGYKLPRLIFWNVNSRIGTIPVIENELGVALISGFSVNIVKMVLSGELDPYKCLVAQLMSERYSKIII